MQPRKLSKPFNRPLFKMGDHVTTKKEVVLKDNRVAFVLFRKGEELIINMAYPKKPGQSEIVYAVSKPFDFTNQHLVQESLLQRKERR
jgi:hypothetical protein